MRIHRKMQIPNIMYNQSPGIMRVLIMKNKIPREPYHQKSEEIQIRLLMTYIIISR